MRADEPARRGSQQRRARVGSLHGGSRGGSQDRRGAGHCRGCQLRCAGRQGASAGCTRFAPLIPLLRAKAKMPFAPSASWYDRRRHFFVERSARITPCSFDQALGTLERRCEAEMLKMSMYACLEMCTHGDTYTYSI